MTSAHRAPAPPADLPAIVLVADHDAPLPPWAGALPNPTVLRGDSALDAAALQHAGSVLLDASTLRFITHARQVHAMDPALQVVAVAPPESVQAVRRALLFAPGLGEVWIAPASDATAALVERAAGVTRQRRSFERTRRRMERERLTISPQRTERALISDAYLASLLRVLPDAVFSVAEGGRILSANAAAQSLFSGRDLVGAHLGDTLHVVGAPARSIGDLLAQASGAAIEMNFEAADRTTRTGELRAARLVVQGTVVWAVVLRDVTAHQAALQQVQESAAELETANEELRITATELAAANDELRSTSEALGRRTDEAERYAAALHESELSFRALADAIPTLAWTARPDGYIDWYNRRWYEYTGSVPEQMEGAGWRRVHHPDVLPSVQQAFDRAIATATPLEMTFPLRGADGGYRTFLTRMVPVTDAGGTVVRWFGTNTDVEEVHAAQAAAEDARRRADEANRAKSQFLANMSHELRTPLNAIGGHVELLEMGLHGPVTAPQRNALVRIRRAQKHLLGLINDVLNFAKVESGRLEYVVEPVPTAEVLGYVAPLMEPQFQARRIRFIAVHADTDGAPLVACGDRDKIHQVLLNLLSNAAKFTPAGGTVRLAASLHDEATVEFTVEDDGPGIPEERRENIFEPFVQLRAQYGGSNEGTGLGLAISRDLSRGMGGDLRVDSAPGGGSVFTLLVPRDVPRL